MENKLDQNTQIPNEYSLLLSVGQASLETQPTIRQTVDEFRRVVIEMVDTHFTKDVRHLFEEPKEIIRAGRREAAPRDQLVAWDPTCPLLMMESQGDGSS